MFQSLQTKMNLQMTNNEVMLEIYQENNKGQHKKLELTV